jgi:hypothetical protein
LNLYFGVLYETLDAIHCHTLIFWRPPPLTRSALGCARHPVGTTFLTNIALPILRGPVGTTS